MQSTDGVVRRDAVRKVQDLAEPLLLGLPEVLDLHEAIGTTDDRQNARDQDVPQRVAPCARHARVGDVVEGLQEGRHADLS